MKDYIITIEETIDKNFKVRAKNSSEALRVAIQKYKNGDFVLDPGTLTCKQIAIARSAAKLTKWIEF